MSINIWLFYKRTNMLLLVFFNYLEEKVMKQNTMLYLMDVIAISIMLAIAKSMFEVNHFMISIILYGIAQIWCISMIDQGKLFKNNLNAATHVKISALGATTAIILFCGISTFDFIMEAKNTEAAVICTFGLFLLGKITSKKKGN